jgi:hypothetical protein
MESYAHSLIAVSTFSSNILFWTESGYFEANAELKPLLHTWSLAVEEQYYLLFPIMLTIMLRWGWRWAVGVVAVGLAASLGLAQWGALHKPSAAFYLLPTRGWELLIGVSVALYLHRRALPAPSYRTQIGGLLGLLLIVYAVLFFDNETPTPSIFTLVPAIGAALVILCAVERTIANTALNLPILVGLGVLSYGAYLWHQPLLALVRYRSLAEPGPEARMAMSVLAFVLAFFSWRLVESPFRSRAHASRVLVFSLGIGAAVLLAGIGLAGHYSLGFRERFTGRIFDQVRQVKEFGYAQRDCWGQLIRKPEIKNGCRLGDPGEYDYVLVGDSHAGALAQGLQTVSAAQDLSGLNLSLASCPPLLYSRAVDRTARQDSCDALRGNFFRSLASHDVPETVILLARWTIMMEQSRFDNGEGGLESGDRAVWTTPGSTLGYEEALQYDVIRSVETILASGREVYLVYPVPEMGWDVPNRLGRMYLRYGNLDPTAASTAYSIFQSRNRRTIAALDAIPDSPRLHRVRPSELLCNIVAPGRCAGYDGKNILYFDDDHLSRQGAELVSNQIIAEMVTPTATERTAPQSGSVPSQ